ncbi:hypothetical protein [Bradyrhizobium sp. CCGUVB23]|uniref:hypothetical protein n=1 Tax=Bradyrhizobium sp. CCGUVB23 TaxID=2949630 RepID=UPI0020B3DAB2|nr:hypothetical protein [Bradyrhizobium sp. CCGUVB23]MCP3460607.1 hypothetical protein [Bradyrhizobium sp. CCGUVB23]
MSDRKALKDQKAIRFIIDIGYETTARNSARGQAAPAAARLANVINIALKQE